MSCALHEAVSARAWVHDGLAVDDLSKAPESQRLGIAGGDSMWARSVLQEFCILHAVAKSEDDALATAPDDFDFGLVLSLASTPGEPLVVHDGMSTGCRCVV